MRYLSNPYPDYSGDGKDFSFYTDEQILNHCQSLLDRICDNLDDVLLNARGYLYTGPGGVAYTLWYASLDKGLTFQKKEAKLLMEKQLKLEQNYSQEKIGSQKSGWLCGFSGVYAVAAIMSTKLGWDPDPYLLKVKELQPAIFQSGAGGTYSI